MILFINSERGALIMCNKLVSLVDEVHFPRLKAISILKACYDLVGENNPADKIVYEIVGEYLKFYDVKDIEDNVKSLYQEGFKLDDSYDAEVTNYFKSIRSNYKEEDLQNYIEFFDKHELSVIKRDIRKTLGVKYRLILD